VWVHFLSQTALYCPGKREITMGTRAAGNLGGDLFLFFFLTFLISWICWLIPVFLDRQIILLRMIGTFGPLLSALVLSAWKGGWSGKGGLKKLLSPLLKWRVDPRWYLFAFFGTAIVAAGAIIVQIAAGGGEQLEWNDPAQLYLVFPVFLYVLFFSVAGEETGWRGYALPRLQNAVGPLKASLIIGFIWGVWHLPLFYIPGNFHQHIPFPLFVLQDIALAVVITWLYNRSGGSLLLVHLFHAASNTTLGVLPVLPMSTGGSMVPLYVSVGILVCFAMVLGFGPGFRKSVEEA
jgi:uncharacterized protein